MTASDTSNPSPDTALVEPRGARQVFLGLGGLAFLMFLSCLAAYHAFGAPVTAGLDAACSEAAFEAGQKFESTGNLARAVLKYRQAMSGQFSSDEERFMCGRAIGDLLVRQERFEEAVAAYKTLPAEAFAHSGAYTGYVSALWRIGNLEAARRLGASWLELADAEADKTQQIWARGVLLKVARAEGDNDLALRYGGEILTLDPGDSTANIVAQILIERGLLDEARARVETMLKHTDSPGLQRAGQKMLAQIDAEAARQGQP